MPTTTTMPSTVPSPSFSLQGTVKPRILQAKFGDGYVQRTADGINTLDKSWQVKWDGLTTTEYGDLIAFFEQQDAVSPFLWTPPNESQYQVLCTEWQTEMVDVGTYTVTATFQRSFNP